MENQLNERLEEALRNGQLNGLHGVVAVRGGQTLLEYYGSGEDFAWGNSLGAVNFGPDTLHDLRSVTKSVTGLLYGIALDEGLVPAPSEPLLRHFPQYPDLAADPTRARLTVEHALTMSLGLEWREDLPYTSLDNAEIAMENAPDRYRYILERPVLELPGAYWAYCGGATALLGRLIANGAGKPLEKFGQEKLFTPLGITRFEWMAGADQVVSPASGLRLSPRDLVRIGELVLAGGIWTGKRLVSAGWLAAMLQPHLQTSWSAQYGYQWYLDAIGGKRMVGGIGNGGQRLALLPELELSVAITAGNYDHPEQWRVPNALLEQVILPGVVG